jgi:hypothetical protein
MLNAEYRQILLWICKLNSCIKKTEKFINVQAQS